MSTYERHVLGNGLRVVTAPVEHAKSATCFLMFAAGSRYETRETNGIAHFTEHMLFKGTERRPTARDIAGEIDAIGGEFNAFTGKEYTGYYVKCAAPTIETALDVLVDMVRGSKLEPEEIDREKGVILEELNMYLDTPRDMVDDVYEDLLYGDQPLGWLVIGRREAIQSASRETFVDYMRRWYTPSRLVVGVGGRIDIDLLPRLEALLGDLGGSGPTAPAPVELPANGSPRVRVRRKESDQAHLCLGVPSYPLDHPDRYVLHLLTVILGGGMA
jgi:predicted Zn-dependent peptidase